LNLLAGSMIGAWCAADCATRMRASLLYRIMAVPLVLIAGTLLLGDGASVQGGPPPSGLVLIAAGVAAGLGLGVVASFLGVAGGELLIATLILLFGMDIKTAGSLSLAVSLPTMLVGFARYSRDGSFQVLRRNRRFVFVMAAGSLAGSFVGGYLLGSVPAGVLLPGLAFVHIVSAAKVWRHTA